MPDLDQLRRRVEVQGFSGLDADDLRTVGRWLRFTPVMNLAVNTIGTIAGSPTILLALAALMALGAVLPVHPWDAVYNRWSAA